MKILWVILAAAMLAGCADRPGPPSSSVGPRAASSASATSTPIEMDEWVYDIAGTGSPRPKISLGNSSVVRSNERGLAELKGGTGAALIPVFGSDLSEAGTQEFLLAGAFLVDGTPIESQCSGCWVFVRVLHPGTTHVTYGQESRAAYGDVSVALHEGTFGAIMGSQGKQSQVGSTTGTAANRFLLLVGFHGPDPESSLVITFSWTNRSLTENPIPFEQAIDDLQARSPVAINPTSSSADAWLSYASIGERWNLARLPDGIEAVEFEGMDGAGDSAATVGNDSRLEFKPTIHTVGWLESFLFYRALESVGNWEFDLDFRPNPRAGSDSFFVAGDAANNHPPHFFLVEPTGGAAHGVGWVKIAATVRSGDPFLTAWAFGTSLDVTTATGLKADAHWFVTEDAAE